jgi:hypothetical protein
MEAEWNGIRIRNIFFLNIDGKIIKIEPSIGKQETVGITSEINIDVAAERRFMFEHVGEEQRKHFILQRIMELIGTVIEKTMKNIYHI